QMQNCTVAALTPLTANSNGNLSTGTGLNDTQNKEVSSNSFGLSNLNSVTGAVIGSIGKNGLMVIGVFVVLIGVVAYVLRRRRSFLAPHQL
ncbi:MAG: hypothetical protein WCK90_02580, partial [archaeon]